jgi:ketosteroid isomerase-like protein
MGDSPGDRAAKTAPAMTEERLLEALEAWNSHDVDRVLAFMVDDATYHASVGDEHLGRTYVGREQVREGVERFFATYPDGLFTDTEVVVAGDQGSAEWTFVFSRNGTQSRIRGCDLFEFEGDLIKTKNAFRKAVPRNGG